jgi:hypothetical protein
MFATLVQWSQTTFGGTKYQFNEVNASSLKAYPYPAIAEIGKLCLVCFIIKEFPSVIFSLNK